MVQRKVTYKSSIQPKTTLKTDSKHASLKPFIHNNDVKTKVVDLKTIKMKKSRSIKRPDVEFAGRPSTKTRLPPLQPTKTSTPKKNTLETEFKHATLKPSLQNYELQSINRQDVEFARRSSTKTPSPKKPLCSPHKSPNYMKSTNSSELHKVCKTSKLNKVRTLTRAPTFKTLGTKTHYFDVKRATCSSTLKDYKFPSYLELANGASEGKGTSVIKVCPYTYCSLNGHHHNTPSPPLKSFLSSRRKKLKTQKNVNDSDVGFDLKDRKDDFFVEIHVPTHEQVSEINFEDDMGMDSDSCVSLEQNLGDVEWVEGRVEDSEDEKLEVLLQKGCFGDEKVEVLNPKGHEDDEVDGEMLPYVYDEIMELLQFSDADTASDSEFTQTGDYTADQTVAEETIEEVTKAHSECLDSFEEHNEANGYESNEEIYTVEDTREGDTAHTVLQETRSIDVSVDDMGGDDSQAEVDNSEVENAEGASHEIVEEDELFVAEDVADSVNKAIWDQNDEDEYDLNEVKLDSIKNEEVTPLAAIRNETEEIDKGICSKGNDSIDDLLDHCSKLKKSARREKAIDDCEEDKDFNPRPPNFLPVEPEPDTEKVDLRHQDMDERRNAQDWMLDHALQQTVNQLAPARKRKVALLVEAFETVLPIPKYEPYMRRNSSVFSTARPVQACR
ncbi:hypothetical protein RND81_10G078900 [Saponaria officinalis]|uniref:Calmodulin-binding domain-containing protein n=1 Tax=Saponaria officinalis TaxID=3572 RepID=A0AAW1HZL4_SAPOF